MSPLEVAGRRVVVVGLGESGLAATRVLRDAGAGVVVSEARPAGDIAAAAADAEEAGARVEAGGHRPEHLEGADLVVTSPGVPQGAPVLRWAQEAGVEVWSELELGARLAACPYVAVTGTNGKTTTTELVGAAMREAGLRAAACGNVGYPFSLAATEGYEALAVEASSFQLRFHRTFHPRVSVLLNVAPDHLDWHGSALAYRDAKRRIYELQGTGDAHVGNRDDPGAAAVSRDAPCPVTWFTLEAPGADEAGYVDGQLVARIEGDHRLGRPSTGSATLRADAAAAAAASLRFGLDPGAVGTAIRSFAPLPHRGMEVADVDGVRFIDDSKATNPHAALASLAGREKVVLVAGGLSKGVDLTPLAGAADRLVGVVAIGRAGPEVVAVFRDLVPVRTASSIEDAARVALDMAVPGGEVLLAPACASQDMFRDYKERGERFAAAARSLAASRNETGRG